jgi:predicted peroxiredoxin
MTDKYLVNCAHGTDNPEKATIALILAFGCSKTKETAVFATAGSYDLFLEDKAPDIQVDGYEPINGFIDGFIENGGKVWLCPACAQAKGVTQEDLIHGVEIAGAPKVMEFLSTGGHTIA